MPLNERARNSPKFIFGRVGAGVAQLGVSRRGRRFVVCASRSLVRQAPAQQRPHRRQEAQQHKERNGRKRCAYPHLTVACGPFSRPICCDSSSRDWWFPGRNSPEFFQKVSKVKHIAPACCQQALKPTLLHRRDGEGIRDTVTSSDSHWALPGGSRGGIPRNSSKK